QRPALERRVIGHGGCRFHEVANAPGDSDTGAAETTFTALRRADDPANVLALGGLLAQEQPHVRPSEFRGSLSCWNQGCREPTGAAANKPHAVATPFTGWSGGSRRCVRLGVQAGSCDFRERVKAGGR